MTRPEDKLPKWRRRLTRIDRDLVALLAVRDLYRQLLEIVEDNDDLNRSNFLFWYLSHTHAQTLLIGVRRHTDKSSGSASLAALVEDVSKHARLVGRSAHFANYDDPEMAAATTWRHLVGSDQEAYPDSLFDSHRQVLSRIRQISDFVDKRVAHLEDTDQIPPPGTFDDLWSALDGLRGLFSHYSLLINAVDNKLTLSFDPSWRSVLRIPWIKPEQ